MVKLSNASLAIGLGLLMVSLPGISRAVAAQKDVGPAERAALSARPLKSGSGCINANGRASRRVNIISIQKLAGFAGVYRVTFHGSISRCVFIATIGRCTAGASFPSGEVIAQLSNGGPNTVFVDTRNSLGQEADLPFNLVVVCP